MQKIEPYTGYNMWNAQKVSHNPKISPIAPSYCESCGASGAELAERFCPKADPARLAATLDLSREKQTLK